jgi:uncharacterized membrane protein
MPVESLITFGEPPLDSHMTEIRDGLAPQALRERVQSTMVAGLAVSIPLIVTLIVLGFVIDFVSGTLEPVVTIVESVIGTGVPDFTVKVITFLLLVVGIFVVGAVTQRRPEDTAGETSFDQVMARIPGLGSLYTSFNKMSRLLLESDTDSFRDVKLVELPDEKAYTLAFLSADTPEAITEVTGHADMATLFVPMAPNPVMGGHVISVDESRVYDVDLTVEEAIRSIVTSGVAMEELGGGAMQVEHLTEQQIEDDPNL